MYTSLNDLREKSATEDELARPDADAIAATTALTKAALEKRVEGKIAAAHNSLGKTGAGKAGERDAPTFIRYTPAEAGASGAQSRVIRMVEAAKDPMEPPKFKHKRVPGGPPSPPAPVMHSPERKLSKEDKQAWKIPPCVSSWKNAKGYTVPLDKRLAADGRGLQEVQISDNFAKLSESLYLAERAAREEVERRSQLQKKLAMREKAAKEDELRALAAKARADRAAVLAGGSGGYGGDAREFGAPPPPPPGGPPAGYAAAGADEDDAEALALAAERDELRQERKRERERERRTDGGAADGKRSKVGKERERDVSERIALGQAVPTAEGALYDQRLFNQSAGMASGLGGDDDGYNIYDKALFAQTSAAAIYRPKKADEDGWGGDEDAVAAKVAAVNRFRPDKGFAGTDGGGGSGGGGPVEFERDTPAESDPFGLDSFLTEATAAGKGKGNAR
jgi:SNW domain-containing protein 1